MQTAKIIHKTNELKKKTKQTNQNSKCKITVSTFFYVNSSKIIVNVCLCPLIKPRLLVSERGGKIESGLMTVAAAWIITLWGGCMDAVVSQPWGF